MSIFVDETTKVIYQGLTGSQGRFYGLRNRDYGTQVVAGTNPKKAGTDVEGIPIYASVAEAKEATGATASCVFIPAPGVKGAVMEAAEAGLELVVVITEGVPAQDEAWFFNKVKRDHPGTRILGPNCPGLISPGKANIGITAGEIAKEGGPVGIVSRSGTLTYQALYELKLADIGVTTCVGIGGDPVPGTSFIDCLEAFEADPETKAVMMIGEIGGSAEEEAAEFIKAKMSKPVSAYVAGVTAPPGKKMGHAGAIVSGGKGTAAAKIEALEDAAEAAPPAEPVQPSPPAADTGPARRAPGGFSPGRLWAYTLRESMEILRDPIRLSFAFLGTALLLLVLGFGISFDVEDLRFAALDRDRTPESRTYLEAYGASRYFTKQPALASHAEMDRRMQAGDITVAIEIPPAFGRDLTRGVNPEVSVWVDGAMPFRAETVRGYVEGLHQAYLTDLARRTRGEVPVTGAVTVEARYRYNQAFLSSNAMVPASIAILLVFIPAILTALGVVRERELGSITNLYVTPTTRLEFLLGKQLPYIAIGMANFAAMTLMALFVFGVPVKGSLIALSLGALLYVAATTGIGLVISTFTRSQLAALFGTAIGTMLPATQFSGMTQPVSTLEGPAALIGQVFPTSYFMSVSVGAFTKALGLVDLIPELLALAVFFPVLAIASALLLPKQER